MAMLHKWATGSAAKDNTKVNGVSADIIQASGDFAYELPNSVPSEAAGTVGAASTPYTLEAAKQYTAAAEKNFGAATKVDGTSVVATKKMGWYNIVRMWKWRKIMKRRSLYGVAPTAPNTKLYEA